jgi:hypothetical protein
MSEVPVAAPDSNGAARALDPADAELISHIVERSSALRARSEQLHAELAEIAPQLRKYDKAIAALKGEPLINHPGRKRGRPPGSGNGAGTGRHPNPPARGTGVSEERMAAVEEAIRRYAETHEEFRQVDIRTMPDTPMSNSGALAHVFERLRQANVIRLARAEGNNKWFRLTREAIREGDAA